MRLIEWEVAEDGYEEQIVIPKEERDLAAKEGISTENKQKVTVQIMNLNTGESYVGRLAITGNQQIYLPAEIQEMLKESGKVRIQILGGWKNSYVSVQTWGHKMKNAELFRNGQSKPAVLKEGKAW